MHWPTLAASDYIALGSMLLTGLFTIFKFIQKVRTNDLHHLDEKIDVHHASIVDALGRIEGKVDDHVRDHAMGLFK